MTVLSDIEGGVLDRLEESNPPKFWSLQDEVRPALVEALNECALLTGEPEVRFSSAPVTLGAATTMFSVPAGAIAILRIECNLLAVRKTTIWDLDMHTPGWEADTVANGLDAAVPDFWFPYGLTQFGIHPQLTAPIQVIMTVVRLPITMSRPYTGAEVVDYQGEMLPGFEQYASHALRLKEGGVDFTESIRQYDSFLSHMAELSKLADLKDLTRFSRTLGSKSPVTEKEVR